MSRQAVLEGAFAILDSYGLADLTMRRLAATLGVQPGGLYWHFDNKQALLTAMADEILCAVDVPAGATPWSVGLAALASRLRSALLAHRDGAELVAAVRALRMGRYDPVQPMLKVLEASGLDRVEATSAARALVHYVVGHSIDEQSHNQLEQLGVTAAPATGDADPDAGFAFGLGIFLDGLAARLAS